MIDKNGAIALAISFFLPGIGLAYVGNYKKGLRIFGVFVLCHIISIFFFNFSVMEFVVWAYGMYVTYAEVSY